MRDELKIARLREELKQCALRRREAAVELIKRQDIVATMAFAGMLGPTDRPALTAAQENFDYAGIALTVAQDRLRRALKE
jgi:hypothetical protein